MIEERRTQGGSIIDARKMYLASKSDLKIRTYTSINWLKQKKNYLKLDEAEWNGMKNGILSRASFFSLDSSSIENN